VRGIDDRRALERRAAGVVHDTVLADLSAIARAPGALTDRSRSVLAAHLSAVDASTVRTAAPEPGAGNAFADALYRLVLDYQWSGVRVDVSGAESLVGDVSHEVRHAVMGAIRASLDNVVQHAATDRAELVVGERDDRLTALVVDDGVGFDPGAVSADRLGLRASITDRIRQVGGTVRVWSGPDGTTVMMTVPLNAGST
jgi:signal transduction histidine kinase